MQQVRKAFSIASPERMMDTPQIRRLNSTPHGEGKFSNTTSEKTGETHHLTTIVVAHTWPFFGLMVARKSSVFFGESLFSEDDRFRTIHRWIFRLDHMFRCIESTTKTAPWYGSPTGVITSVSAKGKYPKAASTTKRIRRSAKNANSWRTSNSVKFTVFQPCHPLALRISKSAPEKRKRETLWNTLVSFKIAWFPKKSQTKETTKRHKHVLSRSISWSDLCMHSSGLHRRRHHDEIGVNT